MPALLRAGSGLRPREPRHQGGEGWRRVDRHRPEGVDLDRAAHQPRDAPRAHVARPAQAQGHHLFQVRHAPTGRRDPATPRDDRSGAVQRSFHRQRGVQRRRHHRRAQQRLGRGEHDADGRAGRSRHRRLGRGRQRISRPDRRAAGRPSRRSHRSGPHRRHGRWRHGGRPTPRNAGAGAGQEHRPDDPPEARRGSTRCSRSAASPDYGPSLPVSGPEASRTSRS